MNSGVMEVVTAGASSAASAAAASASASTGSLVLSSKNLDVIPKGIRYLQNSASNSSYSRSIKQVHYVVGPGQEQQESRELVLNCSVSSLVLRRKSSLCRSASCSISLANCGLNSSSLANCRNDLGKDNFARRSISSVCCASSVPANEAPKDSLNGPEHPPREGEGSTISPDGEGSTISPDGEEGTDKKQKRAAFRSSWDAKDSEGKDYLYRLGKEAANMNITVGARSGIIDDIFVGNFLGKESDIVFEYRQKVTRSFQNMQGDYYIAPAFMEKVVTHITKNFLAASLGVHVPLILGIWGGKGQGKSFQLELICKALGMEPVILSAGELESEWAGEPGRLIRQRYRTASQVVKVQGKMSALVINDLDAGVGRFENTQCTVNNQMVVGSLMNLADNPTKVSVGQVWREEDTVDRVPVIVTGNDLSTIWAPLIRDGRMDKFYWHPTREDIVNIVHHMYRDDGLSLDDIGKIVDTFPNQALDFYGALRSRTYDKEVLKWIHKIGGVEKLASTLVSRNKKNASHPEFQAPETSIDRLLQAGDSLVQEQKMVRKMRLSDEYMKKMTGGGVSLLAS